MKKFFILFAMLVAFASFAKADVIEVSCHGGVQTRFYAEDNDLFITMSSNDGSYVFYFDVVCAQGATDIVDGQTYTLTDMLVDYSYFADYNLSSYVNYVSVSLVRTNGDYDVNITDANARQFHITTAAPTVITEYNDTIDVLMDNGRANKVTDLTATQGVFQLIGADAANQYMMYLAANSNQFAGTYTNADINLRYTSLSDNSVIKAINNVGNFTVTGNATACSTYVEIVTADSILYRITYSFPGIVPDPVDTVDIVMNSASNNIVDYTSAMNLFQLIGADQNEEYEMYLAVNSNQFAGTYTQDDLETQYTGFNHNGISIDVAEIRDFTVTGNATACSTYVEMIDVDNILYRINYSYPGIAPDPTDTIDITMDNAEVNTIIDYTSFMGMYQLQGADQNGEYIMLLAVNSNQIAGTYTQSNIDSYSSGLIHVAGGDTSYIDILSIADFTVTGNAKSCSTYVEILGNDTKLYRITYTYTYVSPEPVDTVVITMDNEEYNVVYDQTYLGMFQLIGADQNDEYRMRLVVYSEQIAGSYTMSDVETFYTELTHNTATDTSYIGIENIQDFTVVGDSAGYSTCIEILSEDLVLYKITYTYGNAPEPHTSVDNVNESEFVIVSENSAIVAYGVEGQTMAVYDMAGRTIMNGKSTSDIERIDVAVPGIYVVRIADKAVKVVVK